MAILQSCCCWQSVRKGSYASALYTMTYYSLNCMIMGVTVHVDLEYYISKKNNNTITNTVNIKPKNYSFLEPAEISHTTLKNFTPPKIPCPMHVRNMRLGKSGTGSSVVLIRLKPPTKEVQGRESVTMIYYLISLVLSMLGVFVSLILIVGLYFEIRFLLVPWMLIVSTSSFFDVSHSVYWLSLDDPNFNPVTAMLYTVEFFVILLNIYAVLCVFSQYQEYKAGRGTADYDTLLETIRRRDQAPPPSIRCSQQQPTGTSYLTGTSHFTKDLCPPNEYSIQNVPVSVETVRSRKVQFTSEGESNAASSVKNEFDGGPELVLERVEKDTIGDQNSDEVDEEDDFVAGRSEYLWCETADERNLIADLMASGKTEFMS